MSQKPTYQELENRCHELEKEMENYRADRKKLLESEEKYRLIADNTGDLIAITTFDQNPLYTYISPSYTSMGYSSKKLLGKPVLSFIHPEDRFRMFPLLERYIELKKQQPARREEFRFVEKLEFRFKDPSGNWQYQESTATNIGNTAILFMSRDVSEKKKGDTALRKSEEAYRSIFENTGTATLIIEKDKTISMANSEFAKLVGYSKEEINGIKKWTEFVVPEDIPFMKEYHYKRRLSGSDAPGQYEFHLIDRYGGIRLVLNRVAVIPGTEKSVSSMHDLTSIRQAEAALRESEEKFRTITSNAHDAIVMITTDGYISYCNRASESMFGYTSEELTGKKVNNILAHAEFERSFSAAASPDGQSSQPGVMQEMSGCKKDGSEIQIELSVSVVSIKSEKHALVIIRDISERKRVAKQLQQSQKMEAIGTLASGIAHDFNNVLGAIFGYSHLAQVRSSENPKVVAYIEEILNASYRAKKLIQHILTFSRQNRPEREVVEIDRLVTEVVELLRASIPSTIAIKYTSRKTSLTVSANPTQIHQIVMNLVTNAYHSIGDSVGMIEITTADVDINADWKGAELDLPFGRYLQLTFKDNGSGIEPAIIDRIFEPYFTTKEVNVGTGMGLATVHGIVQDHNGATSVESRPGMGSTFHIFLPMENMELPENRQDPEDVPTGSEWILLVDDEEMLAETGMLMLEELGYLVVSKTDPDDALELIRSDPSKFDLLITDLTMPVMTGEDLAREVSKIRPDMPVILCSGFSKSLSEQNLARMGFDCILNKPIIFKDLAKTVRATLDGKK